MTKKSELEPGVDYSTLGIGATLDPDRLELDARGAMQISRFRIDIRTKYYNKLTGVGGIVKFDGFDTSTGELVKYWSTSLVLNETFAKIGDIVGFVEQKDAEQNVWKILKNPVNINGIEMVSPGVKGHNPYPKILI